VDVDKRGCFALVGVHCSVVPTKRNSARCGGVVERGVWEQYVWRCGELDHDTFSTRLFLDFDWISSVVAERLCQSFVKSVVTME
jgi:hypothetical protein